MAKDCPCIPCVPPKRHINCHGGCPEFAEWQAQEAAKNALIAAGRQKDEINLDYHCRSVEKVKKYFKIKN